ncbi:MAG: hypothetical protein GX647_03800 [Clostridiales bacterium]|jgi:ABC-2 type transport system ATP-binding protein|nr:hypothetical protein [Clostridiales bacterium]
MQRLPKNFHPDANVVRMVDVGSMEWYRRMDGGERQVLRCVNLEVVRGDRFAIVGDEPFELQLLIEIIGNVKPYESGKCSLVGLGMMRAKRRVLQHVYYVNSQKLLYYHMQGLSWLMFASRRTGKRDAERQIQWLNRLLAFDMPRLCFTFVRHMTRAERVALLLLLTLDIDVHLILADFSQIEVEPALFKGIARLFEELSAQGKAVVFSTPQPEFAEACAGKAAFLNGGELAVQGEIGDLCARYDRRAYQLRFPSEAAAGRAAELLAGAFPEISAARPGEIWLYRGDLPTPSAAEVMRALCGAELTPEEFIVSRPSLAEAFRATREVRA